MKPVIRHGNTTPVILSKLPNWLRLAWLRVRNHLPYVLPRRRYDSIAGWAVAMDIERWLSTVRNGCSRLDHWGSTVIDGELCFVNEPYSDLFDAINYLSPLADALFCRMSATGVSWHDYGTVRVVLHPPPPLELIEAMMNA